MKNLYEKFNGFADSLINLNESSNAALEVNMRSFENVIGVGLPELNIGSREKLSGVILISDRRDTNKVHFVLYVTYIDDPLFKLARCGGGVTLRRELQRISDFKHLLYGGYVSFEDSFYNFDDICEEGIVLEELLAQYIKRKELYKGTNGFTKRYLELNFSDLLH